MEPASPSDKSYASASRSSQENQEKNRRAAPVTKAPSLFTLNGVGVSIYGSRDRNPEDQSHVKTRCLCLVFVPLLALDAWRVIDAPQGRGWYFLRREPLSPFARGWNKTVAVLALLLGLWLGITVYTSTPEYAARTDLKAAAALVKSGKNLEGARLYATVVSRNVYADEARAGFRKAIEAEFQRGTPTAVLPAYKTLVAAPAGVRHGEGAITDAFQLGMRYVDQFAAADPECALRLLDTAERVKPAQTDLAPRRLALLKAAVAAHPANGGRASELAVLLEKAGAVEDAVRVLLPAKADLGASEGARILGRDYLKKNNHAEAYPLLHAYVQARIENLHRIERAYKSREKAVEKEALAELNAGSAGDSFYAAYKAASEADKQTMVNDYIIRKLKTDAALNRTVEELKAAGEIVPLTLDLGILQFNRAQGFADPAARKAELEAAEKTFLAIRSFAGESDDYQMFLGQVYCWLGRPAEARQLFDKLLAKHSRSPHILTALATVYRDLGDLATAREMGEEAYKGTTNREEKYAIARFLANISMEYDIRIAWLEKCDTREPSVQIELNGARGERALQGGDRKTATELLQKAVEGYAQLPKSTATLNNCALTLFALCQASGNPACRERGLAMLREAVAMAPSDSVLLGNSIHTLLSQAVQETLGDAVLPEAVTGDYDLDMLAQLYQNEGERQQVYQRLRNGESMKTLLAFLERDLLLAPKDRRLYLLAARLNAGFRDGDALRKLMNRFRTSNVNLSESIRETMDFYSGKDDAKLKPFLVVADRTIKALLDKPEVQRHPGTRQYLLDEWVENQLRGAILGETVNAGELLAAAETAHNLHPCSASRATLRAAYFFAARSEIARENANFAVLNRHGRRTMNDEAFLGFVLQRDDALAAAVRANPHFQRGATLAVAGQKQFPNWPDTADWAILNSVAPDTAATIAATFQTNDIRQLTMDLQRELNPQSAGIVLDDFFRARMLGDAKGANERYDSAIRAGIPLPPR